MKIKVYHIIIPLLLIGLLYLDYLWFITFDFENGEDSGSCASFIILNIILLIFISIFTTLFETIYKYIKLFLNYKLYES